MKSILIFALLFTTTYSQAIINDNKKITSSAEEIEKINQKFNHLNGIKKVPTIIKKSEWSDILMNWQGETHEEYTYENNRVKSVITYNYNKTDTLSRLTLSYNTDSLLLFYYDEIYVGNGTFEPYERINYIYENNNAKMTATKESYSKVSNIWYPETKLIDEKINNGETIRSVKYYYSLNEWRGLSGTSHTIKKLNSTSSKASEIIDSLLNFDTGEYEILKKESRVYDANENAILIVFSENNGGIFQTAKTDSIYYVNNIPSERVSYKYTIDGFAYKFQKQTNMVWKNYNSTIDINDNFLKDYTLYIYSQLSWLPKHKFNIVYTDAFGSNILLQEEYVSNSWIPLYRATQKFNKNNLATFECRERFDRVNWDTVTGFQSDYLYDLNDNIIENTQTIFNGLTFTWQKTYKYEYSNFITISTGITSTSIKTLQSRLYPNPSTNGSVNINVNLEAASALSIKVTDMKGSIVYTDERNVGKGLNTIELKNLEQGMYIVELNTEYGISKAKLVVQ